MGFFGGGGSSVDLASPSAIGSTTPNTGAFTTLSANNGTLTSSSPAFTLAQTWNSAGVVFTALRANVTDTASNASSLLMDLQVGGSSRFSITKAGNVEIPQGQYLNAGINSSVRFSADSWLFARGVGGAERALLNNAGIFTQSGGSFGWSSSASVISTIDLYVYRDAANILAQRNSTNAQTFRLYNTFTDASNYERGFFRWSSNVLEIGAESAGTGTLNRTVRISAYDTIDFRNTQFSYSMGSVSGGRWSFNAAAFISNVCGLESNYGFQLASTRTLGWVSSTNTAVAPDTALSRNAAGVVEVNNGTAGTFRDLIVRNLRMSAPTGVPATAGATGTEGSIRWDADYIYICTAANTWKRVAIATW